MITILMKITAHITPNILQININVDEKISKTCIMCEIVFFFQFEKNMKITNMYIDVSGYNQ